MFPSDNNLINKVELNPGDESEYPQNAQGVQSPSQPRATKDFKKVLAKSGKEHKEELAAKKKKSPMTFGEKMLAQTEEVEESSSRDNEEDSSEEIPISPFDLSKQLPAKEKIAAEGPKKPGKEVAKVASPSELYRQMAASKEPQKRFSLEEGAPPPPHEGKAPKVKAHVAMRFSQEQPDLSYVNPNAQEVRPQAISAPVSEATVQRATPLTPEMRALLDKIVKEMYTISDAKKTDGIIVIDNHPLFQDARVVVSADKNAPGQLNLTFENLTQAAQKVLDRDENRKTLLDSLTAKGYNVQLFITTTAMEQRNTNNIALAQDRQQDEGREDEGRGGKKHKRGEQDA